MTAVLERPAGSPAWSSMPGWGIVGDLTPPELINARRLHFLRRIIIAGLALVVLLCAAGYAYAMMQHSKASDDLAGAQDESTQLTVTASHYSGITHIESIVSSVHGQVAAAMIHDVDVAVLIAKMRSALPATLSLTNVTISLNNTSEQSVGSAGSAASLDTSGHQHIGTVTLSGSGITLADLAGYVANLAALPGVADVIPSSNATTATVAIKHGKQAPSFTQFNIALTVTDELYSHHFDVTSKGGN